MKCYYLQKWRGILFLLFFTSLSLFAQKQIITGTVTSVEGEPIPGANIVQKGTTNGTV